jgi:hypothetical protein
LIKVVIPNDTILPSVAPNFLPCLLAIPQVDTSALERQIDALVYRLYNLTYDEVKVIEPEFAMVRAEYKGMEV